MALTRFSNDVFRQSHHDGGAEEENYRPKTFGDEHDDSSVGWMPEDSSLSDGQVFIDLRYAEYLIPDLRVGPSI